jgi:hypothetical protein
MRFGPCCLFINEPVSFRTTTSKALSALGRDDQLRKLSGICLDIEAKAKKLTVIRLMDDH